MFFGPPLALAVSTVAMAVDRPKTLAVAGLVISGLTCLLIATMVVLAFGIARI